LVPPARRQEIRRLEEASPRSPSHQAGDRRPRGPHGQREPHLELHANPRCAEEPRPRSRPQHDQGDPQGPRLRTRARARHETALEDVPGCSLGRPGRGGLLHRRGPDHGRIGPVLRLLRDAPQNAHGGDRRNHRPAE
jgi:hypothetical protein